MKKPSSPHFNIGFSAYLEGEIDIDFLKNAIQIVCNENDALRLVIEQKSGIPEQTLLEACDVSVNLFDTSSSEKPIRTAERLMQELVNTPFEFNGELLWKISLIRIGHNNNCMFACFHHIINDGVGCGVFFKKSMRNVQFYKKMAPSARKVIFHSSMKSKRKSIIASNAKLSKTTSTGLVNLLKICLKPFFVLQNFMHTKSSFPEVCSSIKFRKKSKRK